MLKKNAKFQEKLV
ncbi:hypothetical protein Mgra_00005375 [Meloidogyne graminicola]|uniref:Uncharacterized protein n=1 Tax=Meloidogyne graminicola TaxID=189291 RepID=A0A8S9ZPC8_9BILA|nr:hypothetical protein Mgra_00005375 [Meloidogyne graminicola]